MGLKDLSRLNREHPIIFGVLLIFIIAIVVYNTARDLMSYLFPFDFLWLSVFLITIMAVILLYLYEKEIL